MIVLIFATSCLQETYHLVPVVPASGQTTVTVATYWHISYPRWWQ